jgi:hypothetical protein
MLDAGRTRKLSDVVRCGAPPPSRGGAPRSGKKKKARDTAALLHLVPGTSNVLLSLLVLGEVGAIIFGEIFSRIPEIMITGTCTSFKAHQITQK